MNLARFFLNTRPISKMDANLHQATRRRLLVGGSALASAALIVPSAEAQAHCDEILTLDVACDGRTLRINRMDPTATDQMPVRGDTFIVNGKIFPAGTIDQGLSGPDQSGSIGTWVCRGWFYVDDLENEHPHVYTVQMYLLDDGNGLTSDGPEGGMKYRRTITGGLGRWGDVKGDVTEEDVGENDTLLDLGAAEVPAPNIRFVFNMTPRG